MKKLVFILMTFLALTGCSTDDDSQNVSYELAEIVANDLPDQFELGRVYEVTVTYILPSQCHDFVGLDARREGTSGDARRNIYVSAISLTEINNDCNSTIGGNQGTSKFSITIDEEEDYTFYFLVGENDGEGEYDTVTVPVVEDADATPTPSNS